MAKNSNQTDENGNPLHSAPDYSQLKSVSDIIPAKQAGLITYKLEDVQNRNLILEDATIEAGTFGAYAQMTIFDPAINDYKTVTSGSSMILTQVSALINGNALPCRLVIRKLGKTWVLQ